MARDPSFRTVRWLRTLNLLAQAGLLLALCGGLNYLALHYGWRFDLTANHRHALAPETLSYLKELAQPVRIIVTIPDDSEVELLAKARRDIGDLLDDFAHATETNLPGRRITVEFLDLYQNRAKAEALAINQLNSVIVLSGEGANARRRLVSLDALYRIEDHDIKAFLGEQALTTALLEVSNPAKKKIYFLTRHGEMSLTNASDDRGLTALYDVLRQRNFALDTLDLTTARAIPADTDLIVIAGPLDPVLPAETELLRQYLGARAGRLLVLLEPRHPHGLDDLLDDWGVLADDVLICDNGPAGQNGSGDLLLTPAARTKHPVINTLVDYNLFVQFGSARSVRPDPGRTLDASLVVTPLIGTSGTAWGERNYGDPGPPAFTPRVDLPPPLAVATAAERVTTRSNLPFSVPGGRLVAFGGADWIANGRKSSEGNRNLFLDAVNWTVGRDAQLNIPARPVERLQLVLTQQQLQRLRLSLLFALPGATALLGLIVFWTRRR